VSAAAAILEEIQNGLPTAALPRPNVHHGTLLRHGSTAETQPIMRRSRDRQPLAFQAFGVTEPTAGTDTTAIRTFRPSDAATIVVNGQKVGPRAPAFRTSCCSSRGDGATDGSLPVARARTCYPRSQTIRAAPALGAPLAAFRTQPIVAEQGMQVAPRMKLRCNGGARLTRHGGSSRNESATPRLIYPNLRRAPTTIGGKTCRWGGTIQRCSLMSFAPRDRGARAQTRSLRGVPEATPPQLASMTLPPAEARVCCSPALLRVPPMGQMVNDCWRPRIRERYPTSGCFTTILQPVLYSAALLREALRGCPTQS